MYWVQVLWLKKQQIGGWKICNKIIKVKKLYIKFLKVYLSTEKYFVNSYILFTYIVINCYN